VIQKYEAISAETLCENSIADIKEEHLEIGLYPNPAQDVINIQVKGNFNIELLDSKGRLILSNHNCYGQHQINVSDLDKGLYFMQVKTEKGIQSEKLIIQ
jgi:hypothetical protein